MRAALIGNAKSSQSRRFMEAHDLLVARGVDIAHAQVAAGSRDVRRAAKRAVKAGFPLVIVAGGDGTLTRTVDVFAHRTAILGVVPLGTGNSFARSLGIAAELPAAVDAIANGVPACVDLGRVNKAYFANFATIGLSSEIAARTTTSLKERIGAAAYAITGIGPILTHRPFDCRIRWGKRRLTLRTHQIVIANGRYFAAAPLLPSATITDGELALFTTSGTSTWDILRSFVALGVGTPIDLRDAHVVSAPKIRITTSPRVALAIDGHALGRTPARFSVDRQALRVMVPR